MDKSAFTSFEVLTSGDLCVVFLKRGEGLNRVISSYDDGFVRTTLRHLVLAADDRSGSLESSCS